MNSNDPRITHIVVDMLYDFIDGTLACTNGEEAVIKAVDYINNHPEQDVLYVCDSHPRNHCSFVENGGIWPPHCITGTRGGAIHSSFFEKVINENSRPNGKNTFRKGCDPNAEQYSGFDSINEFDEHLKSRLSKNVVISGIATEFCVNETVGELTEVGANITINVPALAYVTKEGHDSTLEKFASSGINLIK